MSYNGAMKKETYKNKQDKILQRGRSVSSIFILAIGLIFMIISIAFSGGAAYALLIIGQLVFLVGGILLYLFTKIGLGSKADKIMGPIYSLVGIILFITGMIFVVKGSMTWWAGLFPGLILFPIGIIKTLVAFFECDEHSIWLTHKCIVFIATIITFFVILAKNRADYNILGLIISCASWVFTIVAMVIDYKKFSDSGNYKEFERLYRRLD